MSNNFESLQFPISYVQMLERIAEYQGKDPEQLILKTLQINPAELKNPQALINGRQFSRLLDIVRDFLCDPKAQLELPKVFPFTIHGHVSLAAMTSSTVREALDISSRFFHQVMPAYEMNYEEKNSQCIIEIKRIVDFKHNNEFLLESVICALGFFLKFTMIPYEKFSVELPHKHLFITEFQTLFPGIVINMDTQHQCFVSFPASFLNDNVITANPSTLSLIEDELEKRQHILSNQHTLSYQVIQIINDRIKQGLPVKYEDIPKALNLSNRTFSRHLKTEGSSFKSIYNNCRIETAKSLLRNTNENISVIGLKLGFSNEASFSRYIKKQTGSTPSELRKQQ